MSSGGLRVELGRLASLLGASGLAVAQPVLDAFGKSPETFIFHNVDGGDLVLFALAVAFGPPLALWWIGLVVGMWAPRWRMVVHGASIGAFVGLAAVQVLADIWRPLAVAGAVVLAVAAWVLTVRAEAFRLWGQILGALPVFALVAFLAASPAGELLAEDDFAAAAGLGPVAPVVLIVLDELPTASIIDAAGRIDAVRFPNLARLAGQSTWYRNHTTQAGFTNTAVPAIFTGKTPELVTPLFTNHPDNIFRLLAQSHDLVVSEALTRLCPTSVCGDVPRAPAGSGEEPTVLKPAMGRLFGDAISLWLDRVRGTVDDEPAMDEFEEEGDPVSEALEASGAPSVDATWERAVASQPTRLTDFLAALQPADRPIAAVLHLVSPHFPWRYLPDGRTYAEPAQDADLPINGSSDPWVANLERQRHLLQASYTDRLVGQILQHVEEAGIYDEAVIAVTADHGIAFRADENRRLPVEEALPEIMWTPLIVKAPGQIEGRVDDANVQTIDLLPTLAALMGVEIPWPVDGVDAAGTELAARGPTKNFRRFGNLPTPDAPPDLEVDGVEGLAAMLAMPFPAVGADEDPIAGLHGLTGRGELIGQPYQPAGEVGGSTFVVDELDRLRGSEDPVLVLTGNVRDDGRGEHVVAVVDDTIVSVSPVIRRNIGGRAFALLLPTDRAIDLGDVRLGLVRGAEILDAGPLR